MVQTNLAILIREHLKVDFSRHVFERNVYALEEWQQAGRKHKFWFCQVGQWTILQVIFIMLASRHFQADLYNCRVILEKKGSLMVQVCRVHCPRALWTMPSCGALLQRHRLYTEKTVSHLWMKEMCDLAFQSRILEVSRRWAGRSLYIPNLLRSSRLNAHIWVLLPQQINVGSTTWWCSCFCSNLCQFNDSSAVLHIPVFEGLPRFGSLA